MTYIQTVIILVLERRKNSLNKYYSISLTNTDNKIIVCFANRLQMIFNIHIKQSKYIKGRYMTESACLIFETFLVL